MKGTIDVNPERIKWSCREAGIDLSRLAAEVQISEKTLTQAIEEGNPRLTFPQIQRIAKYFNRGTLFFLEPGKPDPARAYSTQFRTIANQKPHLTAKIRALIQRAETQRDVFVALREELGEAGGSEFDPGNLGSLDPGQAGEAARSWLSLETRNSFDSYRAAVEGKGILVFRSNPYQGQWQIPKTDPIEGFCLYDPVCPIIVIKRQVVQVRQVFTLFHELGHLLLHRSSFIDEESDLRGREAAEEEANEFAGRLLVPDEFLQTIDKDSVPTNVKEFDEWLRPHRTSWAVSGEVILRRLLDSGSVSDEQYGKYRDLKNSYQTRSDGVARRNYRHREPLYVFGQTFSRTVLEALDRELITSNKASRYLDNIKLKDLRRLVAYIATR